MLTAVPTIAPQREEATVTPTPARKATEVKAQDGAERVVQLAREDLAQRLSLALESIRLVSTEPVEWRDASLGCPQPGMVYAQVITPGFRVVLEAKGKLYEYHADTGRLVVLCGVYGLPFDPVPLMPVAPHGKPSPKPKKPAH